MVWSVRPPEVPEGQPWGQGLPFPQLSVWPGCPPRHTCVLSQGSPTFVTRAPEAAAFSRRDSRSDVLEAGGRQPLARNAGRRGW